MPMPTAITPGPPAGPATPAAGMRLSRRLPAIFRSPTRTSVGHFRRALSDAARASASAPASALTSDDPPRRPGVPRGRRRALRELRARELGPAEGDGLLRALDLLLQPLPLGGEIHHTLERHVDLGAPDHAERGGARSRRARIHRERRARERLHQRRVL